MRDSRIEKLAGLLVSYCADVQPGDVVRIRSWPQAAPLVLAVYREVLRAGGFPWLRLSLDGCDEIFYQEASDQQLDQIPAILDFESHHLQGAISIGAQTNLHELSRIDPKRIARRQKSMEPLWEPFSIPRELGGVKWVGVEYPTDALAQEAGMSLSAYEDFLFKACLPDLENPVGHWRKVHDEQEELKCMLDTVNVLKYEGPQIDLAVSVKDRIWINCDGLANMPDGEIFTAPHEDSCEGWIFFDYPSDYYGKPVEGVRLEFHQGVVTSFSALRGEECLKAGIEMDEGARRIGELSFGTNFGIQVGTRNTLFDEKIGGTIHLALGEAYPESGGTNKSALHWDLISEMKNGSRVLADGKLIYENGHFCL
ncbi:MAG: aminopeptidase [bacterium]